MSIEVNCIEWHILTIIMNFHTFGFLYVSAEVLVVAFSSAKGDLEGHERLL